MKSTAKTPYVLMILDGIGHRENPKDNAVAAANTPMLDSLKSAHPHGLISGSGLDVGLPEGQFGNSEVGHMNLGAGRILFQDSTKISQDIKTGNFFANPSLINLIKNTINQKGAIHILGLLSDGGVHAHIDHIKATAYLALKQGAKQVFLHAFLDGRDTPPKSAEHYINDCQNYFDELNKQFTGKATIASCIGRFFAMDRDNRWERVQMAYDLLTQAKAVREADHALDAIKLAYANQETDEFVQATIIDKTGKINHNDGVIFVNFRADRARQLTQAFVEKDFEGFVRQANPALSGFVMMTQYAKQLAQNPMTDVAYLPNSLDNTLGEYLSALDKTQLRIAETEKYAHVTFFFSGGQEHPYVGEDRILVNSPNVDTYDQQPQMSAFEVTDRVVESIESGQYDVIIINYANGDMVGHTGVFEAAVKAVETVDVCVGRVVQAVQQAGGHLIITADHGNCEQMQDYLSGQVHTQHTTELVPFIYVGDKDVHVKSGGRLCDVAPTLLTLMGIDPPAQMTGINLLVDNPLV